MASQGSGSDGAPLSTGSMLSSYSFTSSSSRDSDMTIKLQKTRSLTVRVLQEITDNFSENLQIGQGAYGKVYRAKLENGEEIAVKVLHNNMPDIDDVQFQREFENLMRLEHNNIVRLVAYCYETQHQPMEHMGRTIFAERTYRALCFEYMKNGSLEKHLSDAYNGFDWHTRYEIIKGAWKGLKHLHEGFDVPIYHLDLKPDNILLDNNMLPKLADFGLSKLFSGEQTMITQSPMGTIGYMPMEFLHGQIVSNKFDIFSLGVVMIKIIAGRGGYGRSAEMPRQEFLDLVHENWRNRMLQTCGAPQTLEAYCEQVNICTKIALSCMEIDRHKRPEIADIIHQLNDTEDVIAEALSCTASTHHSVMNGDLVKLDALTSSEAIPYAERCNEYPILVRITARPWCHAEKVSRPGVDLVLVVDVYPFIIAKTKQAMIVVIEKLGPNDRLAILVGQGGCALKLTFMSDEGRRVARLMVDKLYFGRYFNLADSVQEACEILEVRQVEEDDSRLGFIIAIMLGGNGSTCAEILRKRISSQFPVHTIGVENIAAEVMKYISDKTSGTYSFIKNQGSMSIDIANVKLALELIIGGITKVAATSIRITLTAHEGVAISSIESGAYSSRLNSEKIRSGEIHINDIYAGETKNFIVKLKLPEAEGDMGSKLLTIGGEYKSLCASKQFADTDVFILRPPSGRCSPGQLAMHRQAAAELMRVRLVKAISAMVEVDNGRSIMDGIGVLWEKIRLSKEGQHAPDEALAGFEKDMAEIQKQSKIFYCSNKVSYVLSWLSCHEWQRATTKSFTPAQHGTSAQHADGENNDNCRNDVLLHITI